MEKQQHIIIFSHGFGVKQDDRRLLSDIASAFPHAISILFNYYDVDEEKKIITTKTFSDNVELLKKVYARAKLDYPDALLDIVAHSQGTLIPALAQLQGVRKTILLAPVFDLNIERTLNRYASDPDTEIKFDGISRLRKLDGYVRFVPKEYWIERRALEPIPLYNDYAKNTELVAINADEDTILGKVDITGLDKQIRVLTLPGNHEFGGLARENLIKELLKII